jgi:hypothetical protein
VGLLGPEVHIWSSVGLPFVVTWQSPRLGEVDWHNVRGRMADVAARRAERCIVIGCLTLI